MGKKDFLQQKYCEINQLKNLLQTYPKEYCETIIKVMEKVFDEVGEYLDKEKNKIKTTVKKVQAQKVFTVSELAKYNGKNDAKAYISLGGTVYDVTSIAKWSGGNHYGVTAGKVLDKEFAQCHENKLSITFNKNKISSSEIIGRVMKKLSVIDFAVKETSIEDIVKKMYRNEV